MIYFLGGVPFIEQGPPSSSLRASDSASSSISSPTTTDSGLDSSAKGTSREDLSDLDQCSSSATTPSSTAALTATDLSSPDTQVLSSPILLNAHFTCLLGGWFFFLHSNGI